MSDADLGPRIKSLADEAGAVHVDVPALVRRGRTLKWAQGVGIGAGIAGVAVAGVMLAAAGAQRGLPATAALPADSSSQPAATPAPITLFETPVAPTGEEADPILAYIETDPAWVTANVNWKAERATCAYAVLKETHSAIHIVAHCAGAPAEQQQPTHAITKASLTVERSKSGKVAKVVNARWPREGTYTEDVKRIFPPDIWQNWASTDDEIDDLELQVESRLRSKVGG